MKSVLNKVVVLIILSVNITVGYTQEQLKIMPLGNSITYGIYGGDTRDSTLQIAYRYKLYTLLNAAGYDFDFIGGKNSGSAIFDDPQHAGYPGLRDHHFEDLIKNGRYTLDAITHVETPGPYLYTYSPDIILMHVGTNDIMANDYTSAADVEDILCAIQDYENATGIPVLVIVAEIISTYYSSGSCTSNSKINTFNGLVANMVQDRINLGDKLMRVDMQCAATINYATHMQDTYHPNATGNDLIGIKFFEAIQTYNTAPVINTIPTQAKRRNEVFDPLNLDDYITDPDDQAESITWNILPVNPAYFNVSVDEDRIMSISPKSPDWVGTETIQLIATDSGHGIPKLTKSDTVNLVLQVINDPPQILSQLIIPAINEDTYYSISPSSLVVIDDDPVSSLSVVAKNGENYTYNANTILPTLNYSESLDVNIVVRDSHGAESDIFPFHININPVNDKPVIVSQDILTIEEDNDITINFTDLNVFDPDDTYPDYFAINLLEGDGYSVSNRTITPDNNLSGLLTVPVNVTDKLGAHSDNFNLSITVTEVEDTPLFVSEPITSIKVNTKYIYEAHAYDPDNSDVIEYTVLRKPLWLTYVEYNKKLLFSGTPNNANVGTDTVEIDVTDGMYSAKQKYPLLVYLYTDINELNSELTRFIYPNPAYNYIVFDISNAEKNSILEIYDLQSIKINSYKLYNSKIRIDLSNIKPGIYLYKIISDNKYCTGKFIKI